MPSDIIKFKDENLMVFDQVQKERFKDFTIHLLPVMTDSYFIKKNQIEKAEVTFRFEDKPIIAPEEL